MDQTPPLRLHDLADALGAVRAEIRALKARETELRAALIAARPNGPVTGRHFEVQIRTKERRVFDRDALPKAILGDHRFWMTKASQTVVTRAFDTGPSHARLCDPEPDLFGEVTDLVLIEDV